MFSSLLPQVLSGEQVNLTSSTRLVLSQLPPPPPPLASQPGIGSQPPSLASLSQQDTAQGLLGNACAFRGNLTQHQGSFSISSSSFLPLLQPASSFNTSSYSLSSLPPPSPAPVAPSPKLVPIFRNKCPLHHISVALLRLQKQKEQLSGGGGKTGRMTLPSLGKKTPTTMSSSSSSVCTLPITSLPSRPPPTFPHFNHRSKPPQAAGHPNVKHRSSLSPPSQSRPGIRPAPKLEIKFKSRSYPKPILKQSCERKTAADGSGEAQEPPLASSSSCSSSSRRVSLVRSGLFRIISAKLPYLICFSGMSPCYRGLKRTVLLPIIGILDREIRRRKCLTFLKEANYDKCN